MSLVVCNRSVFAFLYPRSKFTPSLLSSLGDKHTIFCGLGSSCSRVVVMSTEQDAKLHFNSGFNCAESILLTLGGGLRHNNSGVFIPRIATGFGGGVGRNGDMCGALSGGVMAIGLALGRDKAEQSRDPCYAAVDRFYTDFVKEFGSSKCRELIGIDLKERVGSGSSDHPVHLERCNLIVAWAAKRANEIIADTQITDARL
jgi:C_GCAxxG_C_C family probable redox protein